MIKLSPKKVHFIQSYGNAVFVHILVIQSCDKIAFLGKFPMDIAIEV